MKRTSESDSSKEKKQKIEVNFNLAQFMKAWPDYEDLSNTTKDEVLQYIDTDGLLQYLATKADEANSATKNKHQRLLAEIKKEFVACVPLPNSTVEWSEEGGLEVYDQSHYYSGARGDIGMEFEINYSFEVKFSNEKHSLHFAVDANHDIDACSNKVMFEPTGNVNFTEDLTDKYSVQAVEKLMQCIYDRMDPVALEVLSEECLLPDFDQ